MHDRITVRMTDEMIASIDAWIATQPGYVSRQEAVRRFVVFSLEHTGWLSEREGSRNGLSRLDTASPSSSRPGVRT